jgi:hypothetical protein
VPSEGQPAPPGAARAARPHPQRALPRSPSPPPHPESARPCTQGEREPVMLHRGSGTDHPESVSEGTWAGRGGNAAEKTTSSTDDRVDGKQNAPLLLRAGHPRLAVHPLSIAVIRLVGGRQLRSGFPASPGEVGLRLLPSGPDRVRRSPPRGTLPSTSRIAASPEAPDLEGDFDPAEAGCGFRAPPAPHLARPG